VLNRRGLRSLWARAGAAGVVVVLMGPMLAGAPPAGAAPANPDEPTAPSGLGDGGLSPVEEFITVAKGKDGGDTELSVGKARDACRTLPGVVAPTDIPTRYQDNPPPGEGGWVYQVCAETGDAVDDVLKVHPDLESATAFCKLDASRCAVFVFWQPKIKQPLPEPDESRKGYFEGFFTLSPQLGSSPHRDRNTARGGFGYIVNFPTWFWNTTPTEFPKVLGDLGLFGGIAATAWHIETTFDTDGVQACDVDGLHKVGTEWEDGKYPPGIESPSRCGHIYRNIGTYNIHACTTWLIIAVGPFFAVVFPITLCNNWDVPVKESQVLTGGDPRRAPVR
jgi:hypothetical protein